MRDEKQTCETMTLNLPAREMRVLDAIAQEQDLSKTMVMRQALRIYQMIHERMKAGETFGFSGDRQRVVEFVGDYALCDTRQICLAARFFRQI